MNKTAWASLVAWLAYPGVVSSSVAISTAAFDRGLEGGLAVTLSFAVALVVVTLLERAFPAETRSSIRRSGARVDFGYIALSAAAQKLFRIAAYGIVATIAVRTAEHGPRTLGPFVSPWIGAGVAFLAADLGKYAMHRLAHQNRFFWRFHAAHHAPRAMYALNGLRLHPVNLAWNFAFEVFVPLALGLDARTVVIVSAFRGAITVLQHANVAMRLAPLHWVFSTPDLHAWHHSARLDEASSNYGATLAVWDVLFGTRFLPSGRRAPEALGLTEGSKHPVGLVHQLVWPFCAQRIASCRMLRAATYEESRR